MSRLSEEIAADLPRWLSRLIACETVNPPGNESEAAEVLRDVFAGDGVECSIHEGREDRTNVVASVGEDTGLPPLILLSHIDVVDAGDLRWSRPPFSGLVEEGVLWGRGAVDAKGVAVMHLGAFLSAAGRVREDRRQPNRRIIFIASADEEKDSRWGVEYLTDTLAELRRPSLVLTEGGGFALRLKGEPWMMVTFGEKGRTRLKVTARGEGGHASCPPANQALVKLASWLTNLGAYAWEVPSYTTLERFRAAVDGYGDEDDVGLIDSFLQYLTAPGVYVNTLSAGDALNVVPSTAECECEIGVLPSWNEEYMRRCIDEISEGTGVEIEVLSFEGGFEGGYDSPLFSEIERAVRRAHGDYRGLLPILALGRTDGRFFGKNGSVSIGCSPLLPDMSFTEVLKRVHNYDEYIRIGSLVFGTEVLTDLLFSLCGL